MDIMRNKSIEEKLVFIYGQEVGKKTAHRLAELMERWKRQLPEIPGAADGGIPVDQTTTVMITYGDNIQKPGMAPLAALEKFALEHLSGVVSGIHILPFSPWSSDDGFSVMDYRQVNPDWGTWDNIALIGGKFRLMADLVLNHCSAKGTWFREFLAGHPQYSDYFICVDPGSDLSSVFRPRALPLTHEFTVNGRKKHVWTTFSQDQVDLNFANPEVLLEFVDILLSYVEHKVRIIRLDAIGFLWKEIGTSCMHHPKTHAVVKLFRSILDSIAPGVVLITETNVPHKENISYFGDGSDEAHMVYQFPLPPLTLDAFIRGNASILTKWAQTLPKPHPQVNFFNFLASHDGVGVLPARGFLEENDLNNLIAEVKNRGGLVSYKSTPNGDIPYELNISYRDAVAESSLSVSDRAKKFLASQAIMLSMAGVPGIYIHSLLGSGNWLEGVGQTGVNRTINREKLDYDTLAADLNNPESLRGRIFAAYTRLLKTRAAHAAFHPSSDQSILELGPGLFALTRSPANGPSVLCLHSVSSEDQIITLPTGILPRGQESVRDLITGNEVSVRNGRIALGCWEVLWLEL